MTNRKTQSQRRAAASVIRAEYKSEHEPDSLAKTLRTAVESEGKVDLEKLARVAGENGFDLARWKHLNPGMQRMNAGNVLRAKLRRGEPILIGGKPVRRPRAAS